MSTTATTPMSPAQAAAAALAAEQAAAQSVIAGATGNSNLDVGSLVSALVNAKTAGQNYALSAQANTDGATLTALGQLSGALSALQAGLGPLANGTLLSTYTTTLSGTGLTATTDKTAVAGTYTIGVQQIATAQSISSGAFSATAALGTGAMTVSLGSSSFTVNINSSNNTLASIASAINAASGNAGSVSAAVVTGSDGAHLVLTSAETGAANTINVSLSNVANNNGLSSLAVTSTAGTGAGQSSISSSGNAWTQVTGAQDAEFTIDGTQSTSASNTVTALTGVSLGLSAAAVTTPPSTQTLTVGQDTSTEQSDISNFVNLYNSAVGLMGSLSAYSSSPAAGTSAGPLLGDPALQAIQGSLADIVSGGVTSGGSTVSLASLGISLQSDGTLKVDATALGNALTNNPTAVNQAFNAKTGFGAQLNTVITNFTSGKGVIAAEDNAINDNVTSITTQQKALAAYAQQLQSQYNSEFTALNTLMAQSNNNAQYLTQLFGGSNSSGALATAKSG